MRFEYGNIGSLVVREEEITVEEGTVDCGNGGTVGRT